MTEIADVLDLKTNLLPRVELSALDYYERVVVVTRTEVIVGDYCGYALSSGGVGRISLSNNGIHHLAEFGDIREVEFYRLPDHWDLWDVIGYGHTDIPVGPHLIDREAVYVIDEVSVSLCVIGYVKIGPRMDIALREEPATDMASPESYRLICVLL